MPTSRRPSGDRLPSGGVSREADRKESCGFSRETSMSRSASLAAVLALVAAASPAQPADRGGALDVINRAIQAHGGEEALTRARYLSRHAAGVIYPAEEKVAVADQLTWYLPGR